MEHACKIDQLLKDGNLRCTKDRHDLLGLFTNDRTFSASQIAQTYPEKDLSTIYRNLQKLLAANLIRSVHTHTTEEFFELSTSAHHDHRTCPKCQIMACIPCPVASLKQPHILEIARACETCV